MNNSLEDIKKAIRDFGAESVLEASKAYLENQNSLSSVGLLPDSADGRFRIECMAEWVRDNQDGNWQIPQNLPQLLGMSNKELAETMNVQTHTVKMWLMLGRMTKPRYQKLRKFCAERGVDIDYPTYL